MPDNRRVCPYCGNIETESPEPYCCLAAASDDAEAEDEAQEARFLFGHM